MGTSGFSDGSVGSNVPPNSGQSSKLRTSHEDRIVKQTRAKARMNVFTKPMSECKNKSPKATRGRDPIRNPIRTLTPSLTQTLTPSLTPSLTLRTVEVKNYVPRSYPKSPSETKFLTEALLGNNFIFSSLPTSHSKLMIDAMEMKEYAMADEIIIQGDTGKCREQVSNTLKQH